uniref:WD_REPEATS_REGION domain-containing protein n=1 Tax=Globodera pallida TaxID=36090 RepID=A0A183CPF3_GLOPA
VKVWDAQRCLLRFTFRGHSGEITDLSVSYENTLLASSSVDKTIRVWCLRKGTALRIFKGHTGTINSLQWVPLLDGPVRYLLSAGNDCAVMFQRYNMVTRAFEDPPVKFNERATGGARIISATHSPGGNLVIVGDTHQSLMMYKLSAQGVERLYEFQAHSDRIDTLVWSHQSLRFVSGSKDGTAKVWNLDEEGRWSPVELNPFPAVPADRTTNGGELPAGASSQQTSRRGNVSNGTTNNGYKLTMLCWTLEDDMVISIGSDYLLRSWDWRSGQLLAKYSGHQNDVFCLNAHPIHKELVVSAGHDGLVIVWNVYDGTKLSKHRNENSDREAVAIFDNQISPDGTTVACVDAMGHLSVYGVGNNQEAMRRPHEQFYTTDYKPLEIDADGRVTDADTGELPERLPPPPFVKSDGTLLSEQDQRLVPGNDIASKEIIKPCAWLKRDIVPAMTDATLSHFQDRQMEISALELVEFEQKHCLETPEQFCADARFHNNRLRSAAGASRRGGGRRPVATAAAGAATAARRLGGVHYRLAEFLRNRAPRYVLDNDFPEDENDHSYSASENEDVEENDGFMLNGIGHDERSTSSGNTSDVDDEGQEENENGWHLGANVVRRADDEDDENDSDYELGRVERNTVFRERSSWTVTGRRKRRPPRPASADQRQGPSSHETTTNNDQAEEMNRHSARLRARAQRQRSTEEQHPSVNSQPRRYKTRQTAVISSASDEEAAGEAEMDGEEDSRQSGTSRTSKSRSAPLANGFAAVKGGRASSGGAVHPEGRKRRKRRKNAAGRKKVAAERPQQKRRRIALPEVEDEEEEEEQQQLMKLEEEEETEEEEEHSEEEEEKSSDQCDDSEYEQRPGTSKQSFERRENGRKRSAREMTRASVVAPQLRRLRQRRRTANRGSDGEWCENSNESVGGLSTEEHERANAHRRIQHFQQSYSQWLRMTERRRFPYFPQLGDEVVYFLEGHKSYLDQLKKNGLPTSNDMQPRSDLDAMEFCYVDTVEWVVRAGIHMAHLRFHDMQNVLDFLVLKQHFDASKQLNLQHGNRVEAIVDEKFYTGKVMQVTAMMDDYPTSDWCAVCVDWDNGEDDRYSPWDLQALTKGRKSGVI